MAAKTGLIVAGIAGAAALGTAGYFANEWRVCGNLEADYLDATYAIRTSSRLYSLSAIAGVPMNKADRAKINEFELERMTSSLQQVYDRCGIDAGQAATRKGEEVLWNG